MTSHILYTVTLQVYTALDAQPGIDLNADPNAPNLLLIGQQSSATTMVSNLGNVLNTVCNEQSSVCIKYCFLSYISLH